ncbi:MAG: sialate O-acetylesterase [Clostridia bacterium]|nr:sialate O-acetylesterase [Clostridia bacterium]
MKVFLMMGQSNMAGRGSLSEVEPIHDRRCYMLRNGRWQRMCEPINVDRPIILDNPLATFSGVNPAASFAAAYAEAYNEEIGLVPCADGGTSLEDWKIDGQLFLHAYYQAKLAMNVGELTGILWHQGEAESSSAELSSTYVPRFTAIMDEFRSRLGVKLPIVVGELGYFLADRPKPMPYWQDVNKALHELAQRPDIAIASAEGLADRGDALHFNAAAQREFGKRYFAAYQTLKGNN